MAGAAVETVDAAGSRTAAAKAAETSQANRSAEALRHPKAIRMSAALTIETSVRSDFFTDGDLSMVQFCAGEHGRSRPTRV